MYKFNINKLTWLNKLKFNKFATFNLSREKKFYILIFSSIILALFLMDIANKQITNNQLLTRDSLIANKDLSVLKVEPVQEFPGNGGMDPSETIYVDCSACMEA